MNLSGVNDSGWGGVGYGGARYSLHNGKPCLGVARADTRAPGLNSLAIANILAALLEETAARYRLLSLL